LELKLPIWDENKRFGNGSLIWTMSYLAYHGI